MPTGKCRGNVQMQIKRRIERAYSEKKFHCKLCDTICQNKALLQTHFKTLKHIKNFIRY